MGRDDNGLFEYLYAPCREHGNACPVTYKYELRAGDVTVRAKGLPHDNGASKSQLRLDLRQKAHEIARNPLPVSTQLRQRIAKKPTNDTSGPEPKPEQVWKARTAIAAVARNFGGTSVDDPTGLRRARTPNNVILYDLRA